MTKPCKSRGRLKEGVLKRKKTGRRFQNGQIHLTKRHEDFMELRETALLSNSGVPPSCILQEYLPCPSPFGVTLAVRIRPFVL